MTFPKLFDSANPPCFPLHPSTTFPTCSLESTVNQFQFIRVDLLETFPKSTFINSQWFNSPRRPRLVTTPILLETGFLTLAF